MSGNLCRCGAYPGILAAVREAAARDEGASSYVRADGRRRRGRGRRRPTRTPASSPAAPTSSTTSSWGWPRPGLLVDVSRLPLDHVEEYDDASGRAAGRRQRPQQRPRRAPGRAARLPGRRARAARRSLGPDPQPGHDRRQPAAAHPLRLLPGRHHPVQQARARHRLLRARGLRPLQRDPGRQRPSCVATHPSDLAVALAARRRHASWSSGPTASDGCRSPTCTGCRATGPSDDTTLAHGELITAVELPAHRRCGRARPTTRSATGRRTPSRWSRSPPRSTSRTAPCATSGSPGAAWPTSPGAPTRAEAALRGQHARPRTPSARRSTPSSPRPTTERRARPTRCRCCATRRRCTLAAPRRGGDRDDRAGHRPAARSAPMGTHLDRVDGLEKVTGRAAYAVEHGAATGSADPLHLVAGARRRSPGAGCARRRRAAALPTPASCRCSTTPARPGWPTPRTASSRSCRTTAVGFRGQIVALVLAETSEAAREGAAPGRGDLRRRSRTRPSCARTTRPTAPTRSTRHGDRHRRGRRRRRAAPRRTSSSTRPTGRPTSTTTRWSRTPTIALVGRARRPRGAVDVRLHPGRARRRRDARADARASSPSRCGCGRRTSAAASAARGRPTRTWWPRRSPRARPTAARCGWR